MNTGQAIYRKDSHKSRMDDYCWHQKKSNGVSLTYPDGKTDELDGIDSKPNLEENADLTTGQTSWPQNVTSS
jgi:hypothetical protein